MGEQDGHLCGQDVHEQNLNDGNNFQNLQKKEDEVRGVPGLYVITSMGNKVEDERETGAE